jgi:hypothetical protein
VLASVQSSGSITISVAPTPTLVSPNSGTFAQDAAQTVTWTMPGTGVSTGTFRVWLKNTVTNAWVRITPSASPVAAVAGKTSYSVPWSVTQAAGIYKLWVYYYAADGTTVLGTAQSTSTITITVKPRLTSPQSGSFAQGSSQTVAFSLYNAVSTGSFRLWLKNTSTNAWVRITPSATPIAAEAGKTTYSIPWPVNQAAGAYKLWVYYYSDAGGSTVVGTDVSTGTITITADPKPTLTSPQSGSFARNGPAQTITWTMSNGGSATGSFGLWLKNTVTNAWVRITPAAGTIPAEAGKTSYTYAWSVTQPAATYRLWVYYYATNGTTLLGSSVSSGAITLTGP